MLTLILISSSSSEQTSEGAADLVKLTIVILGDRTRIAETRLILGHVSHVRDHEQLDLALASIVDEHVLVIVTDVTPLSRISVDHQNTDHHRCLFSSYSCTLFMRSQRPQTLMPRYSN